MTVTTKRAYNFNAGPSALPLEVLQKAQQELVDFQNSGMSIMEMSHRSATFEEVHNGAIDRLRKVYSIPENYEVLFLQGGASLQFTMIAMNFLAEGNTERALSKCPRSYNRYPMALYTASCFFFSDAEGI